MSNAITDHYEENEKLFNLIEAEMVPNEKGTAQQVRHQEIENPFIEEVELAREISNSDAHANSIKDSSKFVEPSALKTPIEYLKF